VARTATASQGTRPRRLPCSLILAQRGLLPAYRPAYHPDMADQDPTVHPADAADPHKLRRLRWESSRRFGQRSEQETER